MRRNHGDWGMGLALVLGIIFPTSPAGAKRFSNDSTRELIPHDTLENDFDAPLPTEEDTKQKQHLKWYGTPIIAVDLVTAVLVGVSTISSETAPIYGAIGFYTLGAPVVHFFKGQIANGSKPLGLRLAAPLVGFAAGSFLYRSCRTEENGWGGFVFGGVGLFKGFSLVGRWE